MTRKVPSALQGVQAARRRRAFARPLELLDDPETAPRLTPEEQELRPLIAAAIDLIS